MKSRLLFLLLFGCMVCTSAQSPSPASFDGKTWWDQVKVLASDDMEGRETGSPGLAKAAAYIVQQAKKDGLQPVGSDGFYQPVKLRSRQIDESQSSLILVANHSDLNEDLPVQPLVLGEDAMLSSRIDLAPVVDAPLVFVGYGLQVPEIQHDDFAGLDLKGKVAVIFSGSTADMSAALAAHSQSLAQRSKALLAAGAIGYINIPNPASMDIPWSRVALARKRPSMLLDDAGLDDASGLRFGATFNPAHAQTLFEGSGHSFDEIAALGKDRKPLPTFPLAVSIKARAKLIVSEVNSANVVALYPGVDPKLRDQYVVLSAHMDHLGIGEPINGDRIYNGAMDNGSGSALLLDLAAALSHDKIKTRRSILFVWVTAEEKGLLGSRYFAARPTVPAKSLVADINTDMFLPIFPLKLVTVYGLSESDLGDGAVRAAQKEGIGAQPDPEPLRNLFVRSDQYSFIREGVPSLAMKVGFVKGSPEEAIEKKWLTDRYHAPSDDLDQPVDLAAAGKFEDMIRDITLDVANADGPPHWKADSFFKRFEKSQ
jgi:Zn-dependent M28 family amino/carboxypeptidase